MKKVQPTSSSHDGGGGGSHPGTSSRRRWQQQGRRRRRRRNLFFFLLVFVGGGGTLSFLWLSMFVQNNNNNIYNNNNGDHHRITTTVVRLNDFIAKNKTATTTSSAAASRISAVTTTILSTATAATGSADDDDGSSKSKLEESKQTTNNTKNKKKGKVKLQDKLDDFYLQHGYKYNGTDLWNFSDYIPLWMKQYFDWHKQQLLELEGMFGEETNNNHKINNKINHREVVSTLQNSGHKLLVMQCLKTSDSKCGGTADRLKPFLYILKQAALMDRILFLHWTSPCNIDEFLVPPIGGFDWRAPRWLQEWLASPIVTTDAEKRHLIQDQHTIKQFREMTMSENEANRQQQASTVASSLLTPSTPIVRTRLQSVTGFREHYDVEPVPIFNTTTNSRVSSIGNNDGDKKNSNNKREERSFNFDNERTTTEQREEEEPTFKDLYHDVWRIAFRPSQPVAEIIEQEFYSSLSSTKSSSSSSSINRDNDLLRNDNNNRNHDSKRSTTNGYLIPNQFVGVHLRAMYGSRAFRTTAELMDMVSNGLNCGSMHQYHNINNTVEMTSDKYFFASDLGHALELAQEYGTSKKVSVHVVHSGVMENQGVVPEKSLARVKEDGYQHVDGPLHFAKADNLHSRRPSEFYSTFVDLFILGMGRCTVMNRGGFGTFGSLISYNSTCLVNQKTSTKGIQHRCNWTDSEGGGGGGSDDRHYQENQDEDDGNNHDLHHLQSNYVDETTNNGRWWPPPLFLDPMP